ncbi:hypothetical protein KOI35_42960 [Actinoplanes bogorensis]|uniref:Uncharacterized protein n=1 Tax=Paractinoplanes bogorensis TaxID=1610840 RepID=A0ABS5Z3K6_9ACTN|nr:hypothetical protein [Actinoplanes bogorensis]MBU2670284.1 hypothetical protein [Actinoplanes bogorensis]
MSQSIERELAELFAADAAAAPDEQVVAAAAVRRVHRRRRALATTAAAATAVIVGAGVYGVSRPDATPPQAQPPVTSSSAPAWAAPAVAPPAGAEPGDPLTSGAAQCVKEYSAETLAEQAFAFDGTVTAIGPAQTSRDEQPPLDLRSVTFQVHTWFKGGSGATVAVDMSAPGGGDVTSENAPAYRIGTRMLVSGMPRWGGEPLADPIAWGCGFTRYYSPTLAADWATATK